VSDAGTAAPRVTGALHGRTTSRNAEGAIIPVEVDGTHHLPGSPLQPGLRHRARDGDALPVQADGQLYFVYFRDVIPLEDDNGLIRPY
jgi:hypothetical protein